MTNGEDRLRDAVRRRMAELGIRDLAALSTRSGVPVRTINHMLSGKRSRSRYAIEVALGWQSGSLERVVAGGEPREATMAAGEGESARQVFLDVAEAIRQDAELLEEARTHLLRQYDMLLRLSRAERGRPEPPREAAHRGTPEVRGRDLTADEEAEIRAEERALAADRVKRRRSRHQDTPGSSDTVGGAG